MVKKRTNKNIKLGERDEQGKFKVPYTNYGLLDNLKYIFSNIWKYRKIMVLMYICGALTQSVMRYLGSYIGKFLVDIIEAQSNADVPNTLPLWYLVTGIAVVELLAIGGNTLISNRVYINMAYVRFRMITEKNDKLLSYNDKIALPAV